MDWSQGPHCAGSAIPGGAGTVNCLVQILPPSVECHRGAFAPQLPEKAVITISPGLSGFTAIDVSPSLNRSVFVRLGSVLLTTASTIKPPGIGKNAFMARGPISSGTVDRT